MPWHSMNKGSKEKMSEQEIRDLCLKRKITNRKLKELGLTKVYGYRIPLEICTDNELKEAYQYCRSCAEEAAFWDNERKSDMLYDSCDLIRKEQDKRKGGNK